MSRALASKNYFCWFVWTFKDYLFSGLNHRAGSEAFSRPLCNYIEIWDSTASLKKYFLKNSLGWHEMYSMSIFSFILTIKTKKGRLKSSMLMAVWTFFLCNPDCPRLKLCVGNRPSWKCVTSNICLLICGFYCVSYLSWGNFKFWL